jgi:hypothetical protein
MAAAIVAFISGAAMITAGALIIFNVRDSIYRRRLRKRPYA